MARILGVNGIHNWSWSKDSFTDRLLDRLATHHEVVDIQYPRMFALFAYFEAAIERRAKKIVKANRPGDILVAHSFGCLCSIYAMEMGAKFDQVFFFGAAVEDNVNLPTYGFNKLFNIHSNADLALKAGKLLPGHKFGGLGLEGYKGSDPRVVNVPVIDSGHNDYVKPEHINTWHGFIENALRSS